MRSTCGILQAPCVPPLERLFRFTPRMGKKSVAVSGVLRTLAENVTRLKGDGTEAEFVKRTRLGAGTVHRMLYGQNVQIHTLDQLAGALRSPDGRRIEAWQLLVPDFNLQFPPQLFTPELQVELKALRLWRQRVLDMADSTPQRNEDEQQGRTVQRGKPSRDVGGREGPMRERSDGKNVRDD